MPYVDGFVLPVPKKKVQAYKRLAQKAGKVWKGYGALEFRECVRAAPASASRARARAWKPWPRCRKD